ncbi:MAG: cytochrome c [Magnetococcales bacterium]|nr:cytochrome c [Magnetococcales bacterium]
MTWSGSTWAGDPDNGKELHDEKCLSCHAGMFKGAPYKIYTRKERKKKSLKELGAMVGFCNQQVGAQWFDDEITDVTSYLNKTFYQFK